MTLLPSKNANFQPWMKGNFEGRNLEDFRTGA